MQTKKREPKSSWVDPDDAPALTEEWFAGAQLVRRGRPKADAPKLPVNIRLDADIVEHFRKTGPGWQSRINMALRKVAGL